MHYNPLNSPFARTVREQETKTNQVSGLHTAEQYGWQHQNAKLQCKGKMFHFNRVKFIHLTKFTELTTDWFNLYISKLPLEYNFYGPE